MADKAHRLTDEKLEEMEKRLSAIYSNEQRGVKAMWWMYMKTVFIYEAVTL